MLCEICGKETGSAMQVVLDGAELVACPGCACFGDGGLAAASAIASPAQPKRKTAQGAPDWGAQARRQRSQEHAGAAWQQQAEKAVRAPNSAQASEPELAGNYGEIIRHAREKRGLTLKELGEKVFEKESVLHKIERSKFEPDERLRKRLESFLGVSLGAAE